MVTTEPPQAWQAQQHHRILTGEATAFAELCEIALPHLVEFLRSGFPRVDSHQHEMIAIDTLLSYHAKPTRYDPTQLPLFAYLRMAARGDLLNAIDKKQRQERPLQNIDAPHIQPHLPQQELLTETGQLDEWLQEHTTLSRLAIMRALENELDAVDQEILLLMLEGVRDSEQYAVVMNISQLDNQSQRAEIKRAKDRLNKKLRRFGDNLDNG